MARTFTDLKIHVESTCEVQLWACELTGNDSRGYAGLRMDGGWFLTFGPTHTGLVASLSVENNSNRDQTNKQIRGDSMVWG